MPRPAMVMGTETEYSIYARDIEDERLSYAAAVKTAALTIRESIRNSVESMGTLAVHTRNGLRPNVQHIANGARFYLDSLHPEMSIPECQNPRDALIWDAAGERIVQAAAERSNRILPFRVSLYKKLVDGRGHAWGCHENYCIEPTLFLRIAAEEELVAEQKTLATWLVVRQLLVGAGKVGPEAFGPESAFQLTQRADFIREFRGPQTMGNRPVINTRDEPLAHENDWRRLHVICGDANLCQWSTYIKMALTGLMLLLWQDRSLTRFPTLPVIDEDYPKVMRFMSHDSDFSARYPVEFVSERGDCTGKKYMSAANILSFYIGTLESYAQYRTWSSPEEASAYRDAATKAKWASDMLLKGSWRSLYGLLDWPTKRIVVEEYLRRKNRKLGDILDDSALLRRVWTLGEINYSALDPAVSLHARLVKSGAVKTAVRSSEIVRATMHPPAGRASQRASLMNAFPRALVSAQWDSLEFQHGMYTVDVKLYDPMGCSQELIDAAAQGSATPLQFAGYLRQYPIDGVYVTAGRKTHA